MTKPSEERPVEQTHAALREAIRSVRTPEEADRVIEHLERMAAGKTEQQVAQERPQPDAEEGAQQIAQEAAAAPAPQKAERVIAEAAAQIAASEGEDERLLSQGAQKATNPEAAAVVPEREPETEAQRKMLQEALLRRMSPLEAADTALFLTVNQMPRSPVLNALMYGLTSVMNRGDGWVIGLLAATLANPRRGRKAILDVLPALWLATATVEVPIKQLFRRRRPFVAIVRAIVVGRRPGGYSFPSGHSAAAFAGALLLSRHYPRRRALFYAIAALTGFSRIYVGAHYPADVLSGAVAGSALAILYRRLVARIVRAID